MLRRTFNLLWPNPVGLLLFCACATSNPGTRSQATSGAASTSDSNDGAPTVAPSAQPYPGTAPSSDGRVTEGTGVSGGTGPVGPCETLTVGGSPATGEPTTNGASSLSGGSGTGGASVVMDGSSANETTGGGDSGSQGATVSSTPSSTLSSTLPNPDTGGMAPEPFVFGQAPVAASRFKKGINLGNRMEAPNEGDWGGKVLDSDFPFIAQRGFDHVRIPMKFSGHALTSAPYTIDADFFSRADTVVDQALAANLAVIIDMHAYDEMATDPSSQLDRFLALWSQIATRYKDRPDSVAFELMNEPNGELDDLWNDFLAAAITTVRATNPRRLLVVDAVFWADPPKLSMLELPNDANLLVAVHLYEPKLFSMQGKSWMGPEYMTTGLVFPGPPASPVTPVEAAAEASWAKQWFDDYNTLPAAANPSGPATITAQVAYITDYQNSEGRTVYNGEWGPQDGGDMDSRVRLVAEVRKQCEQANVGWAIWDDPNNMKLLDSAAGTWVTPIIDALLPPSVGCQ